MGTFVSTFIPYDATGRVVNLDTEYMYRDDGLKLKVIRFEYYKCDDVDYNWFILAQIECSNVKADRYKVCDLYIECPSNAYVQNAINDLHDELYEVIDRLHDEVYVRINQEHEELYGAVNGLHDELYERINQEHDEFYKVLNKHRE